MVFEFRKMLLKGKFFGATQVLPASIEEQNITVRSIS
jgi:hypothetical protein